MRTYIAVILLAALSAGCGARDEARPPAAAPEPGVQAPAPSAPPVAVKPSPAPAVAPAPVLTADGAQVVSPANFTRAESDTYLAKQAEDAGGLGKMLHRREPASIDNQTVIRLNRDTLYSAAVFDLDAGPVTITLPDAGDRFQSLMVVNQDHFAWTEYGAGAHTFDRQKVGTRYALVGIRTLVNPADAGDVEAVHRLQDAITVAQPGGPGKLELPRWDSVSQGKVRDALLALAATSPGFRHAFGLAGQVDPVAHLMATAAGWGGNPDKDATYLGVAPPNNDGKAVYRLRVKDVPVDAFWSVSVYNAKGYFEKNALDAYSLNNLTALKDPDGAVTIQFGGCDGKVPNCLPTMPGWNYTVRLYRPQQAILDGSWTFPAAEPLV